MIRLLTTLIFLTLLSHSICGDPKPLEPHVLNQASLPEMDAITAFSNCSTTLMTDDLEDPSGPLNGSISGNCYSNSSISACPGEEIQFGVIHQGDPDNPVDVLKTACGSYSEEMDATFSWSTSWEGDIMHNPTTDGGGFIPPLTMPMTEGVYEICLNAIVSDCDSKFGPLCLEINVVEGLERTYYVDADGDGYGVEQRTFPSCMRPPGLVCLSGDCDDNNPSLKPDMLPPPIELSCSVSNDAVTFTWTEYPDYDYMLDTFFLTTIYTLDLVGQGELVVTDFSNVCDFATLTIEVRNPVAPECNIIRETAMCRVGSTPMIGLAPTAEHQVFLECEDHPIIDVIALVDGVPNPSDGIWEPNFFGSSEGFTLGTDPTFDPNGLSPGIYSAIYTYTSADGCTSQVTANYTVAACIMDNDGDGVPDDEDCDDNDPNNFPGNMEICDGRDNDCDGIIDNGFEPHVVPELSCFEISDNHIAFSWAIDQSVSFYNVFIDGVFVGQQVPTDNTYFLGGIVPNSAHELTLEAVFTDGCAPLSNSITCQSALGMDMDGDGVPGTEDCDDTNPNIFPGNTEICDGLDNDCNGLTDDGFPLTVYYLDADGDGFGADGTRREYCEPLAGYVEVPGDCDDSDPQVYPDNEEICDGKDNDCDGIVDNNSDAVAPELICSEVRLTGLTIDWQEIPTASSYEVFVDGSFLLITTASILILTDLSPATAYDIRVVASYDNDCMPMASTIVCTTLAEPIDADADGYLSDVDCDDNNPDINPDATEICDGVDNNCDGDIDEGLLITFYVDNDMDGFGEDGTGITDCNAPLGTAIQAGDCDDTNPNINPAMNEEPYNGTDDDCDPLTLDDDLDGDGFLMDEDCNDDDPAINPDAEEIPGNDIDEDCDGIIEPSSVLEINGKEVRFYPNPVHNTLQIETDISQLTYTILSNDGQVVLKGRLIRGEIDLSLLSGGVYILQLDSEGGNASERIIKI